MVEIRKVVGKVYVIKTDGKEKKFSFLDCSHVSIASRRFRKPKWAILDYLKTDFV